MSITKVGSVITEAPPNSGDQAARTGVVRADSFAIRDNVDQVKQIQFDPSALATNTTATIKCDAANSSTFSLPPFSTAVLAAMNLKTQTATPLTTSIVTISAATQALLCTPAGTLTTLTIVLPATPPDGTLVRFCSTTATTNLIVSASASDTVSGMPTSGVANTPVAVMYLASGTTWYRM